MVSIRKNFLATYRELLELQHFPFDRQLLRVEFHLSRTFPLEFKFWAYRDENFYETPFTIQQEEDLLPDMSYFGYKAEWKKSNLAGYTSECEITVEVERTPDYYYRNYILVYFFLFGLNFMVYFLGVENGPVSAKHTCKREVLHFLIGPFDIPSHTFGINLRFPPLNYWRSAKSLLPNVC